MAALGDMNIKIGADITGVVEKINQLKQANVQLREETSNLSKEYNKNAQELRNLEAAQGKGSVSVKNLADRQKQLAAAIVDNREVLKQSTTVVKDFDKSLTTTATGGISKLYGGLRTLANIIPGIGIAGLIGLIAGPLVDAFQGWWESINKASEATRLLTGRTADLNDVMKDANKDASKQIVDLQLLYTAATNVNLSMDDRIRAVKQLQKEFPDFFANISKETILNGDAKTAYLALSAAIQNTARAKAAVNKLDEIQAQQLENDFKRQKVQIATQNEINAAIKKGDVLKSGEIGSGKFIFSVKGEVKAIEERRAAALKDLDTDDRILQGRRDFVTKFVAIGDIAPNTGMLKEIDDQIAFLKQQKELHASTLAEVKDFNAKIKALQDERNAIDPPKPKKESVVKAARETAELYTETLQHALSEIFKKGFKEPIDPFAGLIKSSLGKISPTEGMAQAIKDLLKGFAEADAAQADLQKRLDNTADTVANIVAPAFATMFKSILDGSKSLGQVLGDLVKKIAEAILKAAALAAIFAFIFPTSTKGKLGFFGAFTSLLGFAEGGAVKRFADGGHIKGPGSKTSDSILARLSAGEYVFNADAVKRIGIPLLDMMNKGKFPYSNFNGLPRFATGGFVSSDLSNIINAGPIIFIPSTIIRGQDIVTSFKRASGTINRNG